MPPSDHRYLRRLAIALAAAAALAASVALAILEGGLFNVGASRPHSALTYWVTKTAMVRSVRREAASVAPPPRFTPDQVRAGFRIYEARCVMCHGAPGLAQGEIAAGMTPPPPYLLDASRQWTPRQLYWIVRHGVKMTAMPAWDRQMDAEQTWAVVGFLEALPDITYEDYLRMRASGAGP
jgi:mono/diheme cytochrome c family protein